MAIEYRVIPRKILAGEDKGKVKYYATTSNTGRTDLEALTRDIERSSTVSGADIRAVLYALFETIPSHLEAGNIVDFGDIGSFKITISSVGEETKDKVDVHSIRKSRITFYPAKKFKDVLTRLHYKKV